MCSLHRNFQRCVQFNALTHANGWDKADRHLAAGECAAAIHALRGMTAELYRPYRALGRLANQVKRNHRSPLLRTAPGPQVRL